jgi:hypothetical protein
MRQLNKLLANCHRAQQPNINLYAKLRDSNPENPNTWYCGIWPHVTELTTLDSWKDRSAYIFRVKPAKVKTVRHSERLQRHQNHQRSLKTVMFTAAADLQIWST